jgi:hypothetical protein
MRRADVEQMDPEAIDLRAELRQRVQAGFGGAPVVARPPVDAELLHVVERDSLGPVVDRLAFRPAGHVQTLPEVI